MPQLNRQLEEGMPDSGHLSPLSTSVASSLSLRGAIAANPSQCRGPNPLEELVVIAAQVISDRLVAGCYRTILAGVGLPHLAGWLATYRLKEKGYDVDLMAEIGMFGYLPRASDPFIFTYHNMHTCKILRATTRPCWESLLAARRINAWVFWGRTDR